MALHRSFTPADLASLKFFSLILLSYRDVFNFFCGSVNPFTDSFLRNPGDGEIKVEVFKGNGDSVIDAVWARGPLITLTIEFDPKQPVSVDVFDGRDELVKSLVIEKSLQEYKIAVNSSRNAHRIQIKAESSWAVYLKTYSRQVQDGESIAQAEAS